MRGGSIFLLLLAGLLAGCGGQGGPPQPLSGQRAAAQPTASQPPSTTVPGTADPDSAAEPQPVASLPPGAYNPGASGFTTADPLSTHPAYGNSGFGLRRYR